MKHEIDISGRWRLWAGARSMNSGMTDSVRETRIPLGTLQERTKDDATDTREFILIAKLPTLSAVHTVNEGPNMWFERLRLVGGARAGVSTRLLCGHGRRRVGRIVSGRGSRGDQRSGAVGYCTRACSFDRCCVSRHADR